MFWKSISEQRECACESSMTNSDSHSVFLALAVFPSVLQAGRLCLIRMPFLLEFCVAASNAIFRSGPGLCSGWLCFIGKVVPLL